MMENCSIDKSNTSFSKMLNITHSAHGEISWDLENPTYDEITSLCLLLKDHWSKQMRKKDRASLPLLMDEDNGAFITSCIECLSSWKDIPCNGGYQRKIVYLLVILMGMKV
jgi:hypothetical protein